MSTTPYRRRLALFVLFFVTGLAISSWVTRTPDIRDLLHASTAEMGVVLFGLSAGSMIGILCSGALVTRFGTRPVTLIGSAGVIISMPTLGLGAATSQSWLATFGLFLFGLGVGGGEVAMNIEGADVEREIGRPVLPAMHGCFSLGTTVGAVAGILFTASHFPVVWHLVIVGGLGLIALPSVAGLLPAGVGRVPRREQGTARPPRPAVWKDVRLLMIGAIVLAMALAEGAANDWLPLVMVDGHGFAPALGSAVFAVFAAAMTVGRFAGGYFIERFGRATVLRASAIAGVAGLALVIFVDNQVVAGTAVILWGLGASLGFPVTLSAAGDSGEHAAARVSLVAAVGYVAFLVGPPLLGYLGEHFGLRAALLVPLALLAAAVFLTSAVGRRPVPAEVG
ncbi:MAG: MFS transporter [Actinoplanes sp.]